MSSKDRREGKKEVFAWRRSVVFWFAVLVGEFCEFMIIICSLAVFKVCWG